MRVILGERCGGVIIIPTTNTESEILETLHNAVNCSGSITVDSRRGDGLWQRRDKE